MKRTISDETEHQSKKMMTGQSASSAHMENPSKLSMEIKFIRASQVAAAGNEINNAIRELSDEELLEMAIMMEKNEEKQQ